MIIVHILEKLKARQKIEVIHSDDDDWFIDINYIEKKSRKLARTYTIVRSDLDKHLGYLERLGWKNVVVKIDQTFDSYS